MFMVSDIATIFLPLSFLTGLFGINVGGMPLAQNAGGFWLLTAVLALLGLGQVWLLKRLHWF